MIEFRLEMLWGLGTIIGSFIFVLVIVKIVFNFMRKYMVKVEELNDFIIVKNMTYKVLWCFAVISLLICFVIMVWTGWRVTPTYENKQKDLNPTAGQLHFSDIDKQHKDLRQKGEEIQKDGRESLDKFREDFLNKKEN